MQKHLLSLAAMNISAGLRTLAAIGENAGVTAEECAEFVYQALIEERDVTGDDIETLAKGGYRAKPAPVENGAADERALQAPTGAPDEQPTAAPNAPSPQPDAPQG